MKQTIDVNAERYQISRDQDTYVVSADGTDYVAADTATLREIIRDLRDSGAVPAKRATYRNVLDPSDFYSAKLARLYPDDRPDVGDFPYPHTIREWGLPVTAANLADPTVRYLAVPHASEDPTGHDILGKVNLDSLLALEVDYTDGIGFIGGQTVIDLDAEAEPAVVDALIGLEHDPVVDEEALSIAEGEEDMECWAEWGRTDFERELEQQLDTDGEITIEPDSELDSEALELIYENGRPGGDGCDIKGAARRWIITQYLYRKVAAPGRPTDDDVRESRPAAIERLVELEAIELPEPDGPEPDPSDDGFRRAWVWTEAGPALVSGIGAGAFLLAHRSLGSRYGSWNVTHVPTGLAACKGLPNRERAQGMAYVLAAGFDWSFTDPEEQTFKDQKADVWARIRELR